MLVKNGGPLLVKTDRWTRHNGAGADPLPHVRPVHRPDTMEVDVHELRHAELRGDDITVAGTGVTTAHGSSPPGVRLGFGARSRST